MNKRERKKLKGILFDLIKTRRSEGSPDGYDPAGDKVVLEAAGLLIAMDASNRCKHLERSLDTRRIDPAQDYAD